MWRYGAPARGHRSGLIAGVVAGYLQIAHPTLRNVLSPGYPNMVLTAFVLVVFSSAFGVGLGLVASPLIRNEDMRQAGAATAADPSDAARSQKTKPPARTIFGFVRGS
jgi:hypothetical protein